MGKLTFNSIFAILLLFSTASHSQTGNAQLFHSLDKITLLLDKFRSRYPHIISEKESIGKSVEGREIWAVKVSDNPDVDEDEPEILYNSLIHGNEPMSMMVLVEFLTHILNNYDSDPEISYLINNRELFFVPVINPDGYTLRQRKNRRDNEDGSYGVDLNRNFGYMWETSTGSINLETTSHMYRGPAPFSEPESIALRDFCDKRNFVIANNMHYFGHWIYYPWAFNLTQTEDSSRFNTITSFGTEINYYTHGLPFSAIGGSAMDWMFSEQPGKSKIYAFTTEVGDSTQNDILNPTAGEIKMVGTRNLYLNKIFAWGPGVIEEFPVIDNFEINKTFLMPGSDTLFISAEEISDNQGTDIYAHIFDQQNEHIDSVKLTGEVIGNKRLLSGSWMPADQEKNYHFALEQKGREKPFNLIYDESIKQCRFTTMGPINVNIEETGAHSFRDYMIKLSFTNYGAHEPVENIKIMITTADTSVKYFSPAQILIDKIEPGTAGTVYRKIFVDVGDNFSNRFSFDFEIFSNGNSYWKDYVVDYPVGVQDEDDLAITEYSLRQNYPNPFNPETVIKYSIAKEGFVTLKVYDILGNEISTLVNEYQTNGNYDVIFNSDKNAAVKSPVATGLYIYTFKINEYMESRKMLLLK